MVPMECLLPYDAYEEYDYEPSKETKTKKMHINTNIGNIMYLEEHDFYNYSVNRKKEEEKINLKEFETTINNYEIQKSYNEMSEEYLRNKPQRINPPHQPLIIEKGKKETISYPNSMNKGSRIFKGWYFKNKNGKKFFELFKQPDRFDYTEIEKIKYHYEKEYDLFEVEIFPNWEARISFETLGGTQIKDMYVKLKYHYDDGIEKIYRQIKSKRLPIPYKEGYRFLGWCIDEKCEKRVDEYSRVYIEANTVLYAKWKKNNI